MIDLKRSKPTILALAMLAMIAPAGWSQEKVDTVHVSQPRTQDLGDAASGGNTKKGLGGFGGLGYGGNVKSGNSSSQNKNQNDGSTIIPGAAFNTTNGNNKDDNNNNNGTGNPGNPTGRPSGNPPPGTGTPPGTGNPGNPSNPGFPGFPGDNPGRPGGGIPPFNPFPPPNVSTGGGGGGAGVEGGGTGMASPQSNQDEAAKEFTAGAGSLDESWPGGCIKHVNNGNGSEVTNQTNMNMIAGMTWPFTQPPFPANMAPFAGSQTGKSIWAQMPSQVKNGGTPATAAEVALIRTVAQDAAIESLFQPSSWLQVAKEVQNTQTQQNADNSANMEKQQASCAIDFVRSYLENFTANSGNQWNRLRNELFMPMAVLLLLPGAIATQAKATVAQGFPIFGEVSPVEGLVRSIVAIFLIPGTYLIVNYGIDVSNSIAYTIQSQYSQIFGSDMYRDAMCAHIRAFGSRLPSENLGHIPQQAGQMQGQGSSARAKFEGSNVDVKLEDPCAGLYQAPETKANEKVPYAVNAQRAAYNGMGAGLAMTWNILCAFQMCYLYYLWFVGPIMAALWVWPVKQLREAFPNWCEGVITICFWSLFWNTTILLMACFRGVDDTGTVIMEALNFLSTACVKFAFDFAGLVKAAGAEAGKMAEKAAHGGGKGGGHKGGGHGGSPTKGGGHPGGGDPKGSHKDAPHGPSTSMQHNTNNSATASPGERQRGEGGDKKPNLPPQAEPKTDPPGGKPPEVIPSSGGSMLDARGNYGVAVDAGPPPALDKIDPPKIDVPSGLAGLPGIAGAGSFSNEISNSYSTSTPGAEASKISLGEQQQKSYAELQQQQASQNAAMQMQNVSAAQEQQKQMAQEQQKQLAQEASAQQQQKAQEMGKQLAGEALNAQQQQFNQLQQQAAKEGMAGAPPISHGLDPHSNPLNASNIQAGLPPQSGNYQDPLSTIKQQADSSMAANQGFGTSGNQFTGAPGMSGSDPNNPASSLFSQASSADAPPYSGASAAADQLNPSQGYQNFSMVSPDMSGGAPMSVQDASVIDVPGGSSSVEQLDASASSQAGGAGFESMAKSSAPADDASIMGFSANQGGAFTPAYETPQMTPSTPAGAPETMSRGTVDEQRSAEVIPMAMNQVPQQNAEQQIVYKQQQEQIIEERKVQQQKQADDQTRKQIQNQQKFVDQQKLARNVVPPSQKPQTPGAKPQQAGSKPEAKADETAEGESKPDTPLMEQVKYGSILRRSRSSNQMSEEEEELMKKLGNSEDANEAGDSKPESSENDDKTET